MAWVADTCVLIDVLEGDPEFGPRSAARLDAALDEGLLLCPVSFVELAPAFEAQRSLQEEFLRAAGVGWQEPWTTEDTLAAHAAWGSYIRRRRSGATQARRPIADLLIGAWALRHSGLITRNPKDFASLFPTLVLSVP